MATFPVTELFQFGDWLRYRFEITLSSGETLTTGYDAWYDESSNVPNWSLSYDALLKGRNPTDTNVFSVMVNTDNGFVDPSVTFQEHEDGAVSFGVLETRNVFFDQGFNLQPSYIRIVAWETWEGNTDGAVVGTTIPPSGYGFNTWNIRTI